jgi:hypothetical protein
MMMVLSIFGVLVALAAIVGLIVAIRRGSLRRLGKIAAIAVIGLVACLALLYGPLNYVVGNLLGLATDNVYLIPAESSVWSFQVSQMNSGSGDWWIYGEDAKNFYHYVGEPETDYILFPKARVPQCAGFQPQDVSTWCTEYRVSRKESDTR